MSVCYCSPRSTHYTRLLACEDVCSDDRLHAPTVCLCEGVLVVPSVMFVRNIKDSFLLMRHTLNDLLTLLDEGSNGKLNTSHCDIIILYRL